jgi:hypothetical protein
VIAVPFNMARRPSWAAMPRADRGKHASSAHEKPVMHRGDASINDMLREFC